MTEYIALFLSKNKCLHLSIKARLFTLCLVFLWSCHKKKIREVQKTNEYVVHQKYAGVKIGSPYFLPYSVNYLFANDHGVSQFVSNYAIDVQDPNNQNTYLFYFTSSASSNGQPDFTGVGPIQQTLINGKAIVSLPIPADYSRFPSTGNILDVAAYLESNNSLNPLNNRYIEITKSPEFSAVNQVGYAINVPSFEFSPFQETIVLNYLPKIDLPASQIAKGKSYRLAVQMTVKTADSSTVYKLKEIKDLVLQNINDSVLLPNVPVSLEIGDFSELDLPITQIIIKSYFYHIGIAPVGINQTIAVGDVILMPICQVSQGC